MIARLDPYLLRSVKVTELADALQRRGIHLRFLSSPAVVLELARARPPAARDRRVVAGLNQLIDEFGPRAALSLSDARLSSRDELTQDPVAALADLVSDKRSRTRR